MLHASISAAMAYERQAELIKAATRRRLLRAAKAGKPDNCRRGR